MNRLVPCGHASSRPRIHSRYVYGKQQSVGHRWKIIFEVAYRTRRRRTVPIGGDAVIEVLFQRPVIPELGTHGHGW